MKKTLLIPAAAVAFGLGTPALAQNTTTDTTIAPATTTTDDDDHDFPWGLLGLIGLAGLLGRKRDDRVRNDRH